MLNVIAITALAYTVMATDDQRSIAVLVPDAVINLASPAAYHDKFCVNVKNDSFAGSIKIRSYGASIVGHNGGPIVDIISKDVSEISVGARDTVALELVGQDSWVVKSACQF